MYQFSKYLTFLMLFSHFGFAQDSLEGIDTSDPIYLALAYQQSDLMLVDPVGDAQILYLKTKGSSKKLLALLFGNIDKVVLEANEKERVAKLLYPEMTSQFKDFTEYTDPDPEGIKIEGRVNPIRSKNMLNMFKQVIAEESSKGIHASIGEFHRWSKEYRRANRKKFSVWQGSKLFLTLAAGSTSRFIVTGHESELIEWILDQEDSTVEMHEIFRKSYQIHAGNVYLTILGIENVLSRYWRVKDRDNLVFTKKLAPITNHFEDRGDKFGAWYHFFGLMTYGFATGSKIKSSLVGRIETLGSLITSKFKKEYQENWINKKAGPIGARLRKAMNAGEVINFVPSRNYLDSSLYLNLTEDFNI